MTIINRLEDYTLEKLAVVTVAGRLELHAWYDGVECLLEAKPSWLAAGLVACVPLDAEIGLDWPMQVAVEIDGVNQIADSATADARAVEALRIFNAALAAGTAREGMNLKN